MKNARLLRDLYRANRKAAQARWEGLQRDDLAARLAECVQSCTPPPGVSEALQADYLASYERGPQTELMLKDSDGRQDP